MSFSADTKQELCRVENKNACCEKAEGYGLLLFSRCFTQQDRAVTVDNGSVARLLAGYAASVAGVIAQVSVKMHRGSRAAYRLSIEGQGAKKALFEAFGHELSQVNLRINRGILECPGCTAAFLRGAFISCGSITDPNKEYHLEFSVPYKKLAGDLSGTLPAVGIQPAIAERGGAYIVYIKDSGKIEDLLTFIGASNTSMELMQIKMYKEAINQINRKTNFETANMDKTYSASAKQTAAIAVIADTAGIASLSEDLQAAAQLRLMNPEMTLKQMAEELHISRSGVNHRMQRLVAVAEELMGTKSIEDILREKYHG